MNARTANAIAVTRQSKAIASTVRTGMNTSCPAELLAPKIPFTSPRLWTNQRVATVGPRTLATSPVPMPASRPNDSVSCQISVTTLDTSSATPVTTRLMTTTRLTPSRPINEPDSGPASPYSTRPAAAANDTEAVDQPGSSVIDRRNAPGAARTPAVTRTTVAATATTTHP